MTARLLLVEDHADNRDMLARRLTRRGFRVALAENGAEALAAIAAEMPELVLMDLSMPVMDGWEATRRLRAQPATARLPILALSAHASAADRDSAMAAGCDDFDTKPVELERLLGKITALLAPKRDNPPT